MSTAATWDRRGRICSVLAITQADGPRSRLAGRGEGRCWPKPARHTFKSGPVTAVRRTQNQRAGTLAARHESAFPRKRLVNFCTRRLYVMPPSPTPSDRGQRLSAAEECVAARSRSGDLCAQLPAERCSLCAQIEPILICITVMVIQRSGVVPGWRLKHDMTLNAVLVELGKYAVG